jgi:Endoglucanase
MHDSFLSIDGADFKVGGRKTMLRGFGLGTWMNLEHFMIGMPGPESLIRETIRSELGDAGERAFFDSFLESFFGEEDARYVESLGANALRIAINYRHFIDDQEPDSLKEDGFEQLDLAIAACKRHGIYAILDMHAAPGGQNPDWHSDNGTGVSQFWKFRLFRDQIARLWGRIAARYANESAVGGYDLLNEPFQVPRLDLLKDYYDAALREIRAVDRRHIVFLEGRHFAMDFSGFNEPDDPLATYSFHYYPSVWNPDVISPETRDEERHSLFRRTLEPFLELRQRVGRPLWCGECGFTYEEERKPYYRRITREMLDLFEENDISWSLWAYKDARLMGIVYPKGDSPWMRFASGIRARWSLPGEQADAAEALKLMGGKFFDTLGEEQAYELQFRLRAIFHAAYARQILAPAIRGLGCDGFANAAKSFRLESCETREEIAQLVREVCRGAGAR